MTEPGISGLPRLSSGQIDRIPRAWTELLSGHAMTADRCHPRRDRRRGARRRARRPAAPGVVPGRRRAGRRAGDVRGRAVRGEGPAQVDPHRRGAAARARARRGARRGDGVVDQLQHGVDVDLRAAADVRVPAAARARRACGARATTSRIHVVGSDAAGVVLRVGSAVRIWKPGDAVTVHCNHVDDQDPSAHDDSMLATNQRIWGYETNFGGLGELTVVKANQLMPKPAHLTWEEAAVNALDQLHELPHAREPERRADDPGPDRADLGCERRHRRVRVPVRAQRRRHAGRRGVEPRARRAAARDGRRARHRPQGRGLPVLEGRHHAGPGGVAPARQEDPRARRAPIPTSCSSTPAGRRWARRCSCARAAARSSPARPRPAS